jgi:hypothetical protein
MHDLTPEIAGLSGLLRACDFGARHPRARHPARGRMPRASPQLPAETVFHRLLHGSRRLVPACAAGFCGRRNLPAKADGTLADLLAIRLIWEEALLRTAPPGRDKWQATVAAHAAPGRPSGDQIVLAILQDAADRARQRELIAELDGASEFGGPSRAPGGLLHRCAFRGVSAGARKRRMPGIETIGFAGFFGLPVAHKRARLGCGRGASAGAADAAGHRQTCGPGPRPKRKPGSRADHARLGPVPAGGGLLFRLCRGCRAVLWRQACARCAGQGRKGRRSRCASAYRRRSGMPPGEGEIPRQGSEGHEHDRRHRQGRASARPWRAGHQQPA